MEKRNWSRWMALLLAGMLLLHVALAWRFRQQVKAGYGDFAIFHMAGKIVGSGAGHRLYDPALQYQTELASAPEGPVRQRALPFNHPPFEAWIFVPLARLGYFPAYCVWLAINLGVVVGIVYALRGEVELAGERSIWFWALIALGYFPVFLSLLQGQDVLLLVLLYALVYRALKQGADWTAGQWLGLGLFRPQEVLPFVFLLLLQKRWRALAGVAVVAAGLGVVSGMTLGWRQAVRYPVAALEMERIGGAPEPADMPNLRGIAASLVGENAEGARGWAVAATVFALSIALLVWAAGQSQSGGPSNLEFALALTVTLLTTYHAYVYDLSLLAIAMVLLADYGKKGEGTVWLWIPMALLSFTPLYLFTRLRWHTGSLLAWALLVWVAAMARELRRQKGWQES